MTHTRGYTLIELVVAVGLFSIVMTLVSGAYFMVINITRNAQNAVIGIDNLAFALETMTRTIRTGTNYSCDTDNVAGADCVGGGANLFVTDSNGNRVSYGVSNSGGNNFIAQTVNGSSAPLTDSSIVDITGLTFYVSGTAPLSHGDREQPYVTIIISGTVDAGHGGRQPFSVRTAATMRQTDL